LEEAHDDASNTRVAFALLLQKYVLYWYKSTNTDAGCGWGTQAELSPVDLLSRDTQATGILQLLALRVQTVHINRISTKAQMRKQQVLQLLALPVPKKHRCRWN
jgi:hypothetical protein